MKILYPNYNRGLVNISNSILKYYGITPYHNTLPELDKYLESDYKNIVLILFDGFGSNLLTKNLGEESFLYQNKVLDITSVFPATTTAATTSINTGLTPVEHCWLGWDIYIKSMNKTVTMYLNSEKGKEEKLADYSIAKKEFPYTTIFEKINENGNAKSYCISPFGETYYNPDNSSEMDDKIVELCNNGDRKYIYAYCMEPDHLMHEHGTSDNKVLEIMKDIDQRIKNLSDKLKDTLILVTADHGHISIGSYIILSDYPILKNMLIRETSLESRATNFFVRDGMQEKFKQKFNELFGKDFTLISKQEVIDKNLFGDGIPNNKFESCIGDFIAIAISDKAIVDEYDPSPLKGLHAGITEEEVIVPLIIIDKKV